MASVFTFKRDLFLSIFQEIDEMLHGQLTEEDEEDVLAELDELLAKNQTTDDQMESLPEVPDHEIIGTYVTS